MSRGTPAWLMRGAQHCRPSRTVLLQVGVTAHAVRCPSDVADLVLELLLADDRAPKFLGPVLAHPLSCAVYFWTQPGTDGVYPPFCRVLDRPAWIPAPLPVPGARPSAVASWLHLPAEDNLLTAPAWLAAALQAHAPSEAGAA